MGLLRPNDLVSVSVFQEPDLACSERIAADASVTALQEAYVRHVIDVVGDLDNVLYEIDNEGDASSKAWQYHMIQLIRDYEATRGKRHPVGITAMWPGGIDTDLYSSGADWISPSGNIDNPSSANGSKEKISTQPCPATSRTPARVTIYAISRSNTGT